ncbi:Cryptochrome/DNA photolyase, FAD-binding domain containing protein [Methylophilaceae bacterium]
MMPPMTTATPPFAITLPADRQQRLHFMRSLFSSHAGDDLTDAWPGGRAEGLRRLAHMQPLAYGKNRNFLDGQVTRLSPYLRHGCLNLGEAIQATKQLASSGADKLLFEFAWRDYWRKVWYAHGHAIASDMEPEKVRLRRLPVNDDVQAAATGLPCMDHFVQTLKQSGYLHNHARMWLASYLVHWRGVDWRAGASWMQRLLLDGDQASNNLSWQWVASTFGSKPYFFNKENLSKYSANQFCQNCQAACPFDGSYEALSDRLFEPSSAPVKIVKNPTLKPGPKIAGQHTVVLFHDEMLSSENACYGMPHKKVFVFDPDLQQEWALHRLQFIADCLMEMPEVEVWVGHTSDVLAALGVATLITQNTPNLMLKGLLQAYQVDYQDEPLAYDAELANKITAKDLKRFSKYWAIVGPAILKPEAD